MCPRLFNFDRLNYARYLSMYYTQMTNLSSSHPSAVGLLAEYSISVSGSNVPACQTPIDQAIEETIDRSAKISGGLIGITRNINAYQR